jgi:hypothetical protein
VRKLCAPPTASLRKTCAISTAILRNTSAQHVGIARAQVPTLIRVLCFRASLQSIGQTQTMLAAKEIAK